MATPAATMSSPSSALHPSPTQPEDRRNVGEWDTFISHMGVTRVVPLLNIHLEHQRWESTPSSCSGHKRSPKATWHAGYSESFGEGDPELRFAACRVLPGTRISQKNVLHVSSLSYPMVTCSADGAKQLLWHVRSCLQEAFHHYADDEPSFTSQFHFQDENASSRRGCFKTSLCTSRSLMVQDITLDFNPPAPFEFVCSLLKLVYEAKRH